MPYCYCTPSRNLLMEGFQVGDRHPSKFMREFVMGAKGRWVRASGRANAMKGWETRRRLMAERHAAFQATLTAHADHCEHGEEPEQTDAQPVERPVDERVTVTVIETPAPPPDAPKAPEPVALALR